MTMVLRPGESVDDLIASGACARPGCGGPLRRWGHGRWRTVRGGLDGEAGFRPRRVRCAGCGTTQVVLPPGVLVRRRDAAAVVGRAWRSCAAGAGSRRVARQLGLPMETVRGWLRRLQVRGTDRHSPPRRTDQLSRTLAAMEADAGRAGWHGEDDLWRFVAYRSQGRLLSNTS